MKSVKVNSQIMESFWEVLEKEKDLTQSYRKRTKVIAYLNIVYFSIWLSFFLLLVLASISFTAFHMDVEIPQETKPFANYSKNVNLAYIWSVVILFGIEAVCQLIASFFLLSSSEVDAHLQPALIQARVWRNITIGYTIAKLLNTLITPQRNLYDLVFLIVRVYMIYVVQMFIKQLKKRRGEISFTKEIYVEV